MTFRKLTPLLFKRGVDVFKSRGKYRIKKENTSAVDHRNVLNEKFNTLQDVYDFLEYDRDPFEV